MAGSCFAGIRRYINPTKQPSLGGRGERVRFFHLPIVINFNKNRTSKKWSDLRGKPPECLQKPKVPQTFRDDPPQVARRMVFAKPLCGPPERSTIKYDHLERHLNHIDYLKNHTI